MTVLTDDVIASFKGAARKLTGPRRRAFQAQATLDYLDGSVWKAERVFGWSHHMSAASRLCRLLTAMRFCCKRIVMV